ncbi:MAG: DUF4198 domain-containing protein [Desulfomonilaceae bacterium]|nr:DUF4198 domain-containing protein [Desulfomonilaceae bacterium]
MFRTLLVTALVGLFVVPLVQAHDTWIEKRDGQILVLRGHGLEVEAYDPSLVQEAKARDAEGRVVETEIRQHKENASLVPKGNAVVVAALYNSGYWLKTTDGWKKATKREGKGKYEIVESIKSKQWCKSFSAPCPENSKPVGQRFEVVPQKDPTTVAVGDTLPIKVIFDEKPVEGALITTGGADASDAKDALKTDKDGKATVAIEKAGLQLIKASHKVPLTDDPDADVLSLASTITFVTQ